MGWTGVRLKPSTVLIFSVALGIAIDVTIRFLVNYKQELASNNFNIKTTVSETIRHTGLSILYTSLGFDCRICHFLFQWFRRYAIIGLAYFYYLVNSHLNQPYFTSGIIIGNRKEKN